MKEMYSVTLFIIGTYGVTVNTFMFCDPAHEGIDRLLVAL